MERARKRPKRRGKKLLNYNKSANSNKELDRAFSKEMLQFNLYNHQNKKYST